MGQGKNWTSADLEYLESNWGQRSITAIAAHLGRSVNAVKIIAQRHGLTRWLHSGEFVTLNQLIIALGMAGGYTFRCELMARHGLPVHHRKAVKQSYKVIFLEEFWAWAEQHKDLIDLSRVDPLALGEEPAWAAEKRKADQLAQPFRRMRDWTPREDAQLKALLKTQRYGYADLSRALQRTEGAIKRRMTDLGVMDRPVPAVDVPWTAQETAQLLAWRDAGYSWELISTKLGRSAMACRGRLERLQKPGYFDREQRRTREATKGAAHV